jgi:hypothetical protein
VGVDNVQLAPLLSDFPATLQDNRLCSLFRVPAADQLAIVGLAHLFRGNHSISHDNWERLDVTVGLSTIAERTAGNPSCQFTDALLYAVQD